MTRCLVSACRALAVALGALVLAPAGAHAALSVTLVGGDALEDRPMTFVAVGSTSTTMDIYARFRVSGAIPCAPTYTGESGSSVFFRAASGTQEVVTSDEPGAYVLCAYLATASAAAPSEVFALPVTVRPNTATLSIAVPPSGVPNVGIPVTLTGTTEIGRTLYAKAKPIGSGPCAQSRSADPSSDSFAFSEPALGVFSVPRLAGPFPAVGQYTLCAWLQERSTDAVAEATAGAVLNVIAPIPVLTSLELSEPAFVARPAGGFTAGSAFNPTTIIFRLDNTNAQVRFTVAARRTGRRVGSSCRRPTRANRSRRPCARYQTVPGSYTHNATKGANYVGFSGRVGGRRLRTGTYRLHASPRTATGRGRTLRFTFRVIRRR